MEIVTGIANFLKRKNKTDEQVTEKDEQATEKTGEGVSEDVYKKLGEETLKTEKTFEEIFPVNDGGSKEVDKWSPGKDNTKQEQLPADDDKDVTKGSDGSVSVESTKPTEPESVEKEKSSEKKGVWKSKAVEKAIIVGLAGLCLYSSRDNLKDAWDYFSGGNKTMEGTATPGTGDNLDTGSGSEDGAEKEKEAIELTTDNIDSMKLESGKTYNATGNFDGFRKEIDFTMGDKFEADQLSVNALKGYNTEVDESNERSKKNGVSFGEYQYDRSTDLSSMSEQELKNLMHDSFDDSLDRIASGEEAVAAAFFAMEKGYQWGDVKVDTIQEANDLLNNGMLKDPETEYDVRCFVVKSLVKDAMEHDIQMVFYGPDEEYQSYFATKQLQTGDKLYYSKCNDTHTGDKGILGYSVDGEGSTSLACFQPIEHGTDPTAISMDEAELIYTSGSEGDYLISVGSEGDSSAGQEGDVTTGTEPDSGKEGDVVEHPVGFQPTTTVTPEQPVVPAPDPESQFTVDPTETPVTVAPPNPEEPTEEHVDESTVGYDEEHTPEHGAPEVPEEPQEEETQTGGGEYTGSATDLDGLL